MGVEKGNIEIVPLGINLEEYSNLPKKGNFREKHNIEDREKLLLFIGRIHKIKGLDLLIESFAILNKDIKDLKLAIVGPDDGFLDNLKDIVSKSDINKDNIIITGSLYGEDKKEAIVDCDIFLMPSQYESFTTSGLEAMACEKPIVLTKNNHIHTWVDGNVGLSCEYEKKDLSNTIKKLIENPNLSESYGKNGLKEIEEKYNWNSVEKQVTAIYKEIINNNKG
jgi:glycosyltransferase involved in cell wall biosynthesis